jgi:hypothetical protein
VQIIASGLFASLIYKSVKKDFNAIHCQLHKLDKSFCVIVVVYSVPRTCY